MTELRRPFGLTTLICVVIAGMIGAGVFTTSGYTLEALGSPALVILAWGLGGAVAMCGAVAYGGLVQRLPESGGEYLYLSRQLHPFAGFMAGWISLTAGFSGAIALAADTFEEYMLPAAERGEWIPEGALAVAVVLLCGLGHSFVVRLAARLQNLVVFIKLAVLVVFLTTAALAIGTHEWHWYTPPGPNGAGHAPRTMLQACYAMATSVMWISLSYAGFNSAIYVASEVEQPERLVPRAMVAGTVLTTILYLLLNLVFVAAAPPELVTGHGDVAAVAAQSLGGIRLSLVIRVAIGLATFSSVASMIMTGPRIYVRMADDGVLPPFFQSGPRVIPRTVLLQAALAIVLILTTPLRELLGYIGTTLSLSSAVTVSLLFFQTPDSSDRRIPKWAAGLYVLATLLFVVLMTIGDVRQLYGTLATMLIGSLLWLLTRPRPTAAG